MTSATGPRTKARHPSARTANAANAPELSRRPRSRGRRVCALGARPPGAGAGGVSAGFTLVELTLALALIVLLIGLAAGSFYGTLASTRIKANSSRLASLLRTARAEAANTGRRLRLEFDEDTGQPVVSIEPDPLGEPGAFRPHQTWWAQAAQLQAGVAVAECKLIGASAFSDLDVSRPGSGQDQDESALATVTFYPDGSSDSARIVLANDDEENPWAVEIVLNGVDGTIQTRQIDTEEEPIQRP